MAKKTQDDAAVEEGAVVEPAVEDAEVTKPTAADPIEEAVENAEMEAGKPIGTVKLTVTADDCEFADAEGNMVATGESGSFDATYGAMIKKLGLAK